VAAKFVLNMKTQREAYLQYMAQTSPTPLLLEVERASGLYMYRPDGSKVIDLISGIGVSNVGHCHPKVVQAVQEQARKYMHLMVYGEVVQSPQVELAEVMASTLPDNLHGFYFLNSGSEAIDAAIKLVKRYSGRNEIITCIDAYHGSSNGALSASGNEYFKQSYRPLLTGFKHIEFNNRLALESISCRTAAVIIETVQGEAGIRVPDKEYMLALRERCTYTGTLLVLDEIQCGAGRTGTTWAFEQFGIVPDVLVAAKGMGGGMPISALIASQKLLSVFTYNPVLGHISTFGGHPVSCVAAKATFELLKEPGLLENVKRKEALFRELLVHPAIREIRSCGLMMAAEMDSYEVLKPVIDRALELGVLTDWFLFCDNSMRIAPPLIITEEEIQEACKIILQAISDTYL